MNYGRDCLEDPGCHHKLPFGLPPGRSPCILICRHGSLPTAALYSSAHCPRRSPPGSHTKNERCVHQALLILSDGCSTSHPSHGSYWPSIRFDCYERHGVGICLSHKQHARYATPPTVRRKAIPISNPPSRYYIYLLGFKVREIPNLLQGARCIAISRSQRSSTGCTEGGWRKYRYRSG